MGGKKVGEVLEGRGEGEEGAQSLSVKRAIKKRTTM